MSNTASAAKPFSIGGGVSVADVGTTLPPDTTTALASGFTALGYISPDGVQRSRSDSATPQRVWGGAVVAVTDEGYTETLKCKVVDIESVQALALAYGESTGNLADGIVTKSKSGPRPIKSYVVDMLLKNNARKRLVVPCGMISAVGDTVYKDSELIGVELTITAMADDSGVTVYEYTKAAAAGSSSGSASNSGGSGEGGSSSGTGGGA